MDSAALLEQSAAAGKGLYSALLKKLPAAPRGTSALGDAEVETNAFRTAALGTSAGKNILLLVEMESADRLENSLALEYTVWKDGRT